jgi:hypothetical protein
MDHYLPAVALLSKTFVYKFEFTNYCSYIKVSVSIVDAFNYHAYYFSICHASLCSCWPQQAVTSLLWSNKEQKKTYLIISKVIQKVVFVKIELFTLNNFAKFCRQRSAIFF